MKKILSNGLIALGVLALGFFVPTANVSAATNPTTNEASAITTSDATLNGTNGDEAANAHSFWVSLETFDTGSPTIPEGVYSSQVLPGTAALGTFSVSLSDITTSGIPSNLPAITPDTTYYYVAWSNVGESWFPGEIVSFQTEAETVAVTDITVSDSAETLEIAETYDLNATIAPENATNQNVSWESNNTDVATVDSNGLVTAIAVGEATITVTAQDGGDTSTSVITVVEAPVCNASGTFSAFNLGSVNGQDGWSATGETYDHEVVANTYGFTTFGCKTFRISDAVASGSFGDWVFTKSIENEAGETEALNNALSGGVRQTRFVAEFDIASTLPTYQAGMHVSVSPDRGDGARMSYLRFDDQEDGIHVFFDDYTEGFVETDIATLDRGTAHTIKFVMDFVDGASNDIVKIYVDGELKITGTSWEEYFRSNEGGTTRTVDSLIIQVRGASTPANDGNGFLFDNFNFSSDETPATHTLTYIAGEHGTLTGNTVQSVEAGSDATEVTAVPDEDYDFVSWSDGVTTASRTDLNIAGDINVTATFERDSSGSTSGSRSNSSRTTTTTSTGEVLGAETFRFLNDLRYGMTSPDVVELQARLRKEGFFTYPTNTGYFGPFTFAAVKAYQTAHPEIGYVTGFVGPLTRAVLNK